MEMVSVLSAPSPDLQVQKHRAQTVVQSKKRGGSFFTNLTSRPRSATTTSKTLRANKVKAGDYCIVNMCLFEDPLPYFIYSLE